jgi:hypothetical protein
MKNHTGQASKNELVKKFKLQKIKHPDGYTVSWLQNQHQLLVSKQCLFNFQINDYKDEILCDYNSGCLPYFVGKIMVLIMTLYIMEERTLMSLEQVYFESVKRK